MRDKLPPVPGLHQGEESLPGLPRGGYIQVNLLRDLQDEELRKIGGRESLLFFPDEPFAEPISMTQVEKLVDQARVAVERNMKLSVALQKILMKQNV